MRFTSDRILRTAWWLAAAHFPVMAAADAADVADRIYRCGNAYTNAPAQPQDCQLMPNQFITVIPGTRPFGAATVPPPAAVAARTKSEPAGAPAWGASSEPVDAKFREAQKRAILVTELQQTRERHAQMVLEYNEGEPDKIGGEARNHQKYLDRLARLKAGIARAERDMDSLQRELSRLPSQQVAQP